MDGSVFVRMVLRSRILRIFGRGRRRSDTDRTMLSLTKISN